MAPLDACILHIQKVVLSLMNTAQELGLDNARPIRLTDADRYKTLDEIGAWLEEAVSSIMSAIAENRNHHTLAQVRKAVEYIETHYAEEKMSLQDICRHCLMSTSYFSLVFKQHTGETFVEYLTRVRMDKAKEMLQHTMLKFYEIAKQGRVWRPELLQHFVQKARRHDAAGIPRQIRQGEPGVMLKPNKRTSIIPFPPFKSIQSSIFFTFSCLILVTVMVISLNSYSVVGGCGRDELAKLRAGNHQAGEFQHPVVHRQHGKHQHARHDQQRRQILHFEQQLHQQKRPHAVRKADLRLVSGDFVLPQRHFGDHGVRL